LDAQSSSLKRVLFAPAAGRGVGGGHVMRCLTLAEALAARGATCIFAVNADGQEIIDRFGGGRFEAQNSGLDTLLRTQAFDTLVIDNYALSADQERPLRGFVRTLAVIDDLADRPHLADLLIDSAYRRERADYDGLLLDTAERLVGPAYALVKSTFGQHRAAALARPIAQTPQRLFLAFGLSDVGGIAGRAAAAVRARHPDVHIDLALASNAQSASSLKARAETDPALYLHVDATNIADLMASADLAIGAGGASTWERACLGLPTLALIVADNQRPTIQRLATDGALLAVDLRDEAFEAAFDRALNRLWAPDLRSVLRRRSSALCDGLGAERVADALLAL
jgi:UDP-2,4-diacetamido-2,4,6-trideoxy-beta-L-altropyranose hydrolase